MTPRWIERIIAYAGGYFWLPCPACGRMTSGREVRMDWGHFDTLLRFGADDHEVLLCRRCIARGVGCRSHADDGAQYHVGCEFRQWDGTGIAVVFDAPYGNAAIKDGRR